MKYGFSIIVRGEDARPATFDAMAEKAEAIGLDTLWASDHLVMMPMVHSRYPGTADGQLPEGWKRTYYQPFSVLNYLAGRTTRVRLGTSVLILPMRNPIEVAAQVAELDQLSGGRISFGVGVGWFREEYDALGYPFCLRGRRANDGLEIVRKLWTGQAVSHQSEFYTFADARLGPSPVQQPHPPIYIGGHTSAALKRAARFADVWHPFKVTSGQLLELRPRLAHALAAEGRTIEDFQIAPKILLAFQDGPPSEGQPATQGRPQDIIDALKRYQDAGATEFCFDISPETASNAVEIMERFANDVRPKL